MLRIEIGGTSTISEDGYIEGAPELVAEIATSSAAIDLGAKQNAYRRNGVQEYLVWQTFENRFSWFRLQAEEFVSIEPNTDGIIRSSVFPGLWLAVDALLEGRMIEVLNGLQAGMADPAHQAFIQVLALSNSCTTNCPLRQRKSESQSSLDKPSLERLSNTRPRTSTP